MNDAIGAIYDKYKQMSFQQKYDAINCIIINNQDSSAATKEGWSMMVAKAA